MLVDKLTRPGNFEHPRAGSTGNLHRTNALEKMVWSDQGCHMAARGAIQELIDWKKRAWCVKWSTFPGK